MSFLEEGCDVWLKNIENMVTGSGKNNIWKSIPVLRADVKALFDLNWIMEFSEPCLLTLKPLSSSRLSRDGERQQLRGSHGHQDSSGSSFLRSDTDIEE